MTTTTSPVVTERDRALYLSDEQIAMRSVPGVTLCRDTTCDLSGGWAHVGPCIPCNCGARHAAYECPMPEASR